MKVTKKHQPIDSHRGRGGSARRRATRNKGTANTRSIPSPLTPNALAVPGIN